MKFKWLDDDDAKFDANVLDRTLVQYVEEGINLVRGRKTNTFGLPNDAASVCGLKLRIATVHLPDNTALLCPPQVQG